MNSRDNILNRIKKAYQNYPSQPIPSIENNKSPFPLLGEDLLQAFQDKLTSLTGEVEILKDAKEINTILEKEEQPIICLDENIQPILQVDVQKECEESQVPRNFTAITSCEVLVAQTGSVIVSTGHEKRFMFSSPSTHVVLAKESQLVDYLENGLQLVTEKYGDNLPNQITNITGPSRTADIEKTLVLGAHGPKKLIVCIIKG